MRAVTDTSRNRVESEKLTIKVIARTSSPPDRVLDAGRDFSERRADVWPNVKAKHLEVHARGEMFAEVTEGTWVVGLFWERCRYGYVAASTAGGLGSSTGSTTEERIEDR